jgi:hypothetical protein
LFASQYSVTGTPRTSSITKYGRPASVAPASSTRAMCGWSIIASACRSASNRAITCRVSIPSLITFSATRRRTGSRCSAIHTVPNPPWPISCNSLYRPIDAPAHSEPPASLASATVSSSMRALRPPAQDISGTPRR